MPRPAWLIRSTRTRTSVVRSIAVQADGKILAGGVFTTLAPNGGATVTRNRIARLETDGRLDQTLNLSTVGSYVTATAVQPDGKILIGGSFTTVLGVTRNNIARLNTDGTLDTAFNPNANDDVYSIAVQADGKILVGGFFTERTASADRRATASPGSMPPPAWLIRSTRTRTVTVYAIAVQADGKILAGGDFTTASADRRATTSPGSMPRPAWLIRSTRTRTIVSIQSRCRRTARF